MCVCACVHVAGNLGCGVRGRRLCAHCAVLTVLPPFITIVLLWLSRLVLNYDYSKGHVHNPHTSDCGLWPVALSHSCRPKSHCISIVSLIQRNVP